MIRRWREWRIERAGLALADAEHTLGHWGDHFGVKPSERARMVRRVERAKQRLTRVAGTFGEKWPEAT